MVFQWSLSCLNKEQKSRLKMLPRKCRLKYDLKTLGLLLRSPNLALMIVRPLRIDPYKSNNSVTYFSIVGQRCLKEIEQKQSFFEQVDASRYLLKSNFFTSNTFQTKFSKTLYHTLEDRYKSYHKVNHHTKAFFKSFQNKHTQEILKDEQVPKSPWKTSWIK